MNKIYSQSSVLVGSYIFVNAKGQPVGDGCLWPVYNYNNLHNCIRSLTNPMHALYTNPFLNHHSPSNIRSQNLTDSSISITTNHRPRYFPSNPTPAPYRPAFLQNPEHDFPAVSEGHVFTYFNMQKRGERERADRYTQRERGTKGNPFGRSSLLESRDQKQQLYSGYGSHSSHVESLLGLSEYSGSRYRAGNEPGTGYEHQQINRKYSPGKNNYPMGDRGDHFQDTFSRAQPNTNNKSRVPTYDRQQYSRHDDQAQITHAGRVYPARLVYQGRNFHHIPTDQF